MAGFQIFISVHLSRLQNYFTEAAVRRCFSKWMFLQILQYSQENTYVGLFFK